MRIFKNSDGSFDVLKENQLFHVKSGRAKYVGQIGPAWKAWGAEVKRIPKTVLNAIQ